MNTDPFKDGRMLSGRVRDKDENFTFQLWGRRLATPDEIQQAYDFWLIQQGQKMNRVNKTIDVAWNG